MRSYHFNWVMAWQYFPQFVLGLAFGVWLAAISLLIGSVIGLLAAFGRRSGPAWLRAALASYVEMMRNIPLLLLVYFAFYGLPKVGITFLSNVWSFVVALSLYAGAHLTEVFRAGVASLPSGSMDAAKAIGLSPWQRTQLVTLPLAFRIVLPSLSNTFVSLFKDTSLASVIGVRELTYAAIRLNLDTFRIIEAWTFATAMYLLAAYAIVLSLRRFERRVAVVR